MKFRSTAFLAVLLAVLCAAYWGKQRFETGQVVQQLEAKRLFTFLGTDITYLEIEQIAEEANAAERVDAETWKFVKPNPTIKPLHTLWSRVADTVSVLMNERTLENAAGDLAQYGLDEPALTVKLKTGAGAEHELRFGYMEPSQTYRYAQLDGGDIFLLKKSLFFELDRSRDLLRHSFLVLDRESPILRFEYAIVWRGDSKVSVTDEPLVGEELVPVILERASAEDIWVMSSPYQAAANQERVIELVNEIQFGMAEGFIDDPTALEDYGLAPPAYRITVFDEAGNGAQTLLIGDKDETGESGGFFAKWENADGVFHVNAHMLTLFPRTPSALREKRLLGTKIGDLSRIDFQGETGSFSFVHDEEKGWAITGENVPPDINQVAVSNYLSMLKNIQAHSFQEGTLESNGLDAPQAKITLHYKDGQAPGAIALKPFAQEENYYLATQDNGQVVLIFSRDAEALLVTPDNFRSRVLLSFKEENILRADFSYQAAEFSVEKVHGKWLVKLPESYTLSNQSDIPMLLQALNPLKGDPEPGEVVDDPNLYGFDPPVFSITLYETNPEDPDSPPRVLGPVKIGYPTSLDAPQRFVTLPDRPGLFRVNNETLEAVRTALQGLRPR